MKYMKLGTKPDTFYTEDATRSVLTDVPPDLVIKVNNTKYLLHKFPLLLKCGQLQRLWSEPDEAGLPAPITLNDFPGGEAAFELCCKFCYGITISLSANNFVQAIAAATYLHMTESVASGNLIAKLEGFFNSCILHGWKDSIITLQNAAHVVWHDEHRIIQPCLDSVVQKILTHPSKVTWSYTYTRPGFRRKQHHSSPKDWWTEDLSDLDLDLFRAVIYAIRSSKKLHPALVGEALHVYACKKLPNPEELNSNRQAEETMGKQLRVLEAIVSMIPGEPGSVTGKFLVRLLKIANMVDASPSVKAELVRRLGCQLDEVSANDLLFPLSGKPQTYDIDIVEAIMENFLAQFRRPPSKEAESDRRHRSMARVALIFDSYLEFVAHDPDLSASRFLNLAVMLPEIAREGHDGLYQAIDSFLKEHPELSKSEKKQLCNVIDCKKLSPAARTHAIANDRMPLRTIVQLLFIQQDKAMTSQPRMENHQSLNAFRVHKQGGKTKPRQEMPEFKRKEAEERKGCESEQVMPKHEVSKVGEASSSHNYSRGKRPEETRTEEKKYDSKSITA